MFMGVQYGSWVCVCASCANEMKNGVYVPAEHKSQQKGRVTCVPA